MKKILMVLTVLCGILLWGCDSSTTATTTQATTTNTYDYSDFGTDHILDPSLQLLMPEVTYYIYYYGINCTHCREIKSRVLGIAAGLQEDTLYFVSVSSTADIGPGAGVTRTPTLLKIVNGAVSGHYEGESEIMPILESLH
jgi:hypothetical protein